MNPREQTHFDMLHVGTFGTHHTSDCIDPVPPEPPLLVTDLESLARLSKPKLFRASEPIIIALPGLSGNEAEALTARLNGYRNECGCSLGAKSMAAGFAVALISFAMTGGLFNMKFLWRLPLAFAVAFLCAGLGKVSGIAIARLRLRLEVIQLDRTLTTPSIRRTPCPVPGRN